MARSSTIRRECDEASLKFNYISSVSTISISFSTILVRAMRLRAIKRCKCSNVSWRWSGKSNECGRIGGRRRVRRMPTLKSMMRMNKVCARFAQKDKTCVCLKLNYWCSAMFRQHFFIQQENSSHIYLKPPWRFRLNATGNCLELDVGGAYALDLRGLADVPSRNPFLKRRRTTLR